MTAPFRDPPPVRNDPDFWPPTVELSPQTIASYMAQARRMRIDGIREAIMGIVAVARKFLRR